MPILASVPRITLLINPVCSVRTKKMVCPFGFVAAALVFGPTYYANIRNRYGTPAAVVVLAIVVATVGYMLNKGLSILS